MGADVRPHVERGRARLDLQLEQGVDLGLPHLARPQDIFDEVAPVVEVEAALSTDFDHPVVVLRELSQVAREFLAIVEQPGCQQLGRNLVVRRPGGPLGQRRLRGLVLGQPVLFPQARNPSQPLNGKQHEHRGQQPAVDSLRLRLGRGVCHYGSPLGAAR